MSPELHTMARRMGWGYVRRKFPHVSDSDKEDLVQEGIIAVWRKGTPATNPALVSIVVRNGIVDAARKMFGRYQRARNALSHQVYLDGIEETTRLLGHHEDDYAHDAEAVREYMTPLERHIASRREQGYMGKEIAEELGLSEPRVSQHITNARKRIDRSRILEAA